MVIGGVLIFMLIIFPSENMKHQSKHQFNYFCLDTLHVKITYIIIHYVP